MALASAYKAPSLTIWPQRNPQEAHCVWISITPELGWWVMPVYNEQAEKSRKVVKEFFEEIGNWTNTSSSWP